MTHDPAQRFLLDQQVPKHAWDIFGKWYSRTGVVRKNDPIREGKFQSDEDWYYNWYGQEDEEDE